VAAGAGTAADTCDENNSDYCLAASPDDDTDDDTDGQPFACPTGQYVFSDFMTEAVAEVLQCTPVPATDDDITDELTECDPVVAEEAAAEVIGVDIGDVTVVLTGPDTVATVAVQGVTENDAVVASCTKTGGSGTCALAVPVAQVVPEVTTCPEPAAAAAEEDKAAGAATAAPLAIAAVLAAVFA